MKPSEHVTASPTASDSQVSSLPVLPRDYKIGRKLHHMDSAAHQNLAPPSGIILKSGRCKLFQATPCCSYKVEVAPPPDFNGASHGEW